MKKLNLNKEKIARLSNNEARSVQGGGTNKSTDRTFTCCWCTDLNSNEPNCDNNDFDSQPPKLPCDNPWSEVGYTC